MSPHEAQFQAIQSMLAAGHRCVRIDRHSLLLLAGVGGFLCVATQGVITPAHFPEPAMRGTALLLWLAFWLGGASLLDLWLTRRAREHRAETLPFAQAQITRAWWMLLSMGCLGSFAMFFYGGGAMIYGLWIILLGLGVYFFGLFSARLVEWIGLATLLLGVAALAAGLPYGATRWLAASAFAVGMPLAGWLNRNSIDSSLARRSGAVVLWLALVVAPALLVPSVIQTPSPDPRPVPLAEIAGGEQVLRLEAGSTIALRAELAGVLLSIPPQAELPLTLNAPLELSLHDGEPDGRYRVGNGPWHDIHDGLLNLRIDRLSPRLEAGQPVVRAHARLDAEDWP